MSEGDPGPTARRGRDRVFAVTRWVAVLLLPFLVVAAALLFAFPARTGELFAWAIDPPLSAYLLASAYVGGVSFFARVATAVRWHHVAVGFPAVAVFAAALLVATVIHLDRFSDNLSFVVWVALYAVAPLVVVALYAWQRAQDPRTPDPIDFAIPWGMRLGLVGVGVVALVTGAAVYAFPDVIAPMWAWELTPLTAQVLGAVLSLTGVVNAGLLRDHRWSSFRTVFQAQVVSLIAIAASLVAGSAALRWDTPATPGFIALVAAALAGYGGFSLWCEQRARRAAASLSSG